MSSFQPVPRDVPTMYFFGVTTGRSSSRKVFPAWAAIVGQPDAQLVGVDFPINAPADEYRRAVEHIRNDPLSLGALVTTHKINTLNAARDLFDELTKHADLCNEVSSIYKRDGRLIGHAVDPVTSARSMAEFIPPGYWGRTGADIMCLGAGGSAVAIATHFITNARPEDRPRRMLIVNRSQPKLDSLRALVERLPDSGITFEWVQNENPEVNDRLMADLPPGSMVINATGMGKDTSGSPVTDAGQFPLDGFAWELNYRGELDFLHQARAQQASRRITAVDGWTYFILGWAAVMSNVFNVDISGERLERFAAAAEAIR